MPWQNLSGWTLIIILIAVILLFGAPKLPSLAKNLAESMKIFRKEFSKSEDNQNKANQNSTADTNQTSSSNSSAAAQTEPESKPNAAQNPNSTGDPK